jgi:hypothetical protein
MQYPRSGPALLYSPVRQSESIVAPFKLFCKPTSEESSITKDKEKSKLTTCSRILFEKLTVAQLVKRIIAYFWN